MVDPRGECGEACAVRKAIGHVGKRSARDVRRLDAKRCLPRGSISISGAASDVEAARAAEGERDRTPATDTGGLRLPPVRYLEYPTESRAGRRFADGRRLLSGQPGPHDRRGTAESRSRGGSVE